MTHLYQILSEKIKLWRENEYQSEFPVISEIFDYARIADSDELRFLRAAQLKALEVYWYLRLIEKTPKVFSLYNKLFSARSQKLTALGIDRTKPEISDILIDFDENYLFEKIRTDDEFVSRMKFEAIRESMTLDYPSYILALAMGAGKTILIGTIIATEFAMAMEYPKIESEQQFIKNALVFAPGKTILGALREIADIPFNKVLPPRLYKQFAANYKLTFTQDGEKNLPIIQGSNYNIIVTNTEKIRIQKSTGAKRGANANQIKLFDTKEKEEIEVANLRLQALASLPNLGIFSDEAHHLNGQDLTKDLKKVRKTVDYLHENTDVICVINTTGTPYYEKQLLKDVVTWYGLSEGIRDNVLKDVEHNIKSYSFDGTRTNEFLELVLQDFFENYRNVRLPNGAWSKIAIYFPQEDDLTELRPTIERKLIELEINITTILKNTSKSTAVEIADFDRLNDPSSPHRVILLVNKGTEGWNCPSLFATVLARKLKTSNNFVLQAGTRCLRQVVGNKHKASIYLSNDNVKVLDSQMQETFGESLKDIQEAKSNSVKTTITLKKLDIPPLVVKKIIRQIVQIKDAEKVKSSLKLTMPQIEVDRPKITVNTFITQQSKISKNVLRQTTETPIELEYDTIDLFLLSSELAANFHLDNRFVYESLQAIYQDEIEVPSSHRSELENQITEQLSIYETKEFEVEEALALVKSEGFDVTQDGDNIIYTAQISYPKAKEHLILAMETAARDNPNNFGFHYTPYNFDSSPENDYFTQMIAKLNAKPEEIEDIYFIGGTSSISKTDLYIEYKGKDGKWHNYFPDFIVRLKNGKFLIVEIKAVREKDDEDNGINGTKAMAMRKWENLNPEKLKYQIIYSDDTIPFDELSKSQELLANL
ncbi:MAG: DEAD/DEAH box helicase family protein [Pyrinomonadaceae bacterium]|nr:DEAD/DEAH box helicase family protein [Pyrinomonadaceae bacterium]